MRFKQRQTFYLTLIINLCSTAFFTGRRPIFHDLPTPSLGGNHWCILLFHDSPSAKEAERPKEIFGRTKKGDEVITIGGLHGTVVSVYETTVTLEVDGSKGTKMKFEKSSISRLAGTSAS